MQQEPYYTVHWPRAQKMLAVKPVAPRLDALAGKTVAFVWDYLFRGDEIFAMVQRKLAQRFPGIPHRSRAIRSSACSRMRTPVLRCLASMPPARFAADTAAHS